MIRPATEADYEAYARLAAELRHGHGSALMAALRAAFVAAGATSWRLNVMPDNAAAIALYRKHGMREAYRAYKPRVPSSIPLVPASGVALAPLTAEDDAALEARFELQRGQLAHARARAASQSSCAMARSPASVCSPHRSQARSRSE